MIDENVLKSMRIGDEVLNLNDLNFYFYAGHNEPDMFEPSMVYISGSKADAMFAKPIILDQLSFDEIAIGKEAKVCYYCGSAKVVVPQNVYANNGETVDSIENVVSRCDDCHSVLNESNLISRSEWNKNKTSC